MATKLYVAPLSTVASTSLSVNCFQQYEAIWSNYLLQSAVLRMFLLLNFKKPIATSSNYVHTLNSGAHLDKAMAQNNFSVHIVNTFHNMLFKKLSQCQTIKMLFKKVRDPHLLLLLLLFHHTASLHPRKNIKTTM